MCGTSTSCNIRESTVRHCKQRQRAARRRHAAALRAHHHTNERSPSAACRLAHPAARLARKCARSFSRRASTIH
eukprot:7241615-Alexandrium_andersonii.AAC.1